MKTPLVTIVIPYVNHSEFIAACWNMLQEQQFRDFDVVFVDNGSTDGSSEAVRKLAGEHAGMVTGISESRSGIPFARNAGLNAARGKYITFLDVDDRFTPEKLSVLTELMEQHPGVVMAYGQTRRVYIEEGTSVIQDKGAAKEGVNRPPLLALDWTASFYRLPQTGATLIRTEYARKAGGFPEDLLMGNDDAGFHIRIALMYPVLFHEFVAVEYFRHGKSEGARLNASASVHLRYYDAYRKSIEPLARNYFEKTGDIRLWGLAQRAMFTNLVRCQPHSGHGDPQFDTKKLWNFYRLLLPAYKYLPFGAAQFLYKSTRRIPSTFFPDRYPLSNPVL